MAKNEIPAFESRRVRIQPWTVMLSLTGNFPANTSVIAITDI